MQLKEQLNSIRKEFGEWTAHNIELIDNISTMVKGSGERYIHRQEFTNH